MDDAPAYAELHCLSRFSFLRGASDPAELVATATERGYTALALTDECSLAGAVRAHEAARESGLPLLHGSELHLAAGEDLPPLHLVLLATDAGGYANLAALITTGRRRADKGSYHLTPADIAAHAEGCLALWIPPAAAEPDPAPGHWLAATFPGRAWLAAEFHRDGRDEQRRATLTTLQRATGLPVTAAGEVHMHRRGRRALQDLVTAIRHNTTLEGARPHLFPNGERHLRPRDDLARLYPADWLAQSAAIAGRCRFSLDELEYAYPEDDLPADQPPAAALRRAVEAGMAEHWPEGAPHRVARQVEHELAVIAELGYEAYFLTVADLVTFARNRGILCQGRGSAANSAVCYCLGITAVDPARSALLFERFLSPERGEPPDIDVDFEHQRREEVIQYVFAKYGRDRAALAATVIRYRPRGALRDAARALGFEPAAVDRLSGALARWDHGLPPPEALREAGFDPEGPALQRLLNLAGELVGTPRHLSQHVGGMVIAREPLYRQVPVENAAMEGRTVIQWDKDDLAAMGMLKVDLLSLGMLSAIRRAFDLVAGYRGRQLSLAAIPAEDPAVFTMLSRGDSLGVFQVESRAQMAMLPRLRPATFYDLVIQVSIVRPGPIQGDMVHPYLRRRQGLEPVEYPGEAVRGVLERTLGVPIFQEQVIELTMVAAGFSAAEADHLRRSMAAWKRGGGLEPFRERLLAGMAANGYAAEWGERIFEQIRGFGEYGFPESHAASFALLVWVSAWLKYHEPAAFAAALLNSQPMGFYAPAQIVADARDHGVEVRPVDVTASAAESTLEGDGEAAPALRLGLGMVHGLSRAGIRRLLEARSARPFAGVDDCLQRAGLDARDRAALADGGALAALAGDRRRAWWAVLGHEPAAPAAPAPRDPAPELAAPTEGEELVADYASLGLTLGRHPVSLLRDGLNRHRCTPCGDLAHTGHGQRARVAGLVINRQQPHSARGTLFITLEDESGHANLILRPWLKPRHRRALLAGRMLQVEGVVQRQGEVVHLLVDEVTDRTPWLGELPTRSRDFG